MTATTDMQDYRCRTIVNVTPQQAFEAIGNIEEWWTQNIEGSSSDKGAVFTVRFTEPSFVTFKVTELIPAEKAVWEITDCYLHWLNEKKEWNGTVVVWDLAPVYGGTVINMTHVGLTPQAECFADCKKGWDHYILDSLLKLITEGIGMPQQKKAAD